MLEWKRSTDSLSIYARGVECSYNITHEFNFERKTLYKVTHRTSFHHKSERFETLEAAQQWCEEQEKQ